MVLDQDIAQVHTASSDHGTTVVAVAKHQPTANILRVLKAGFTHIGENFLEHFQQHNADLLHSEYDTTNITWHYIGKLQSRKINKVCRYFDWLQTVENSRQLELVQQHSHHLNKQIQCLIQVNISAEPSKSGINIEQLASLVNKFDEMDNCVLRGLMMMPKLGDVAMLEQCYDTFANLQQKLNLPTFDTLSLGTSQDWQLAVEKGSTMVRLGESLLGKRK